MVSVAEWTDPPLTTIRQDIEEMGRLMARLLLRALGPSLAPQGVPALSSIVTPTRLVVRASA
jgi:DNA-binding LacI/PurR family transcriptional regulator